MKTKDGSVCDFCGAGEVGDGYLIEHDNGVVICDQCVRAITALLKTNPEGNVFGIRQDKETT